MKKESIRALNQIKALADADGQFKRYMRVCEVINFSSLFRNKGTNKYFRAYSDVKIKEADHE